MLGYIYTKDTTFLSFIFNSKNFQSLTSSTAFPNIDVYFDNCFVPAIFAETYEEVFRM